MHEPFSLLVPVYDGDRPDYLRRAFRSAVHDQTVRPDQVIIVRDGPVRAELAECLDELCATSPVPVTFVPLARNGGLGPALDRGLAAHSSSRHSASSARTGPSRTMITWSGRTVWSWTALRNARRR